MQFRRLAALAAVLIAAFIFQTNAHADWLTALPGIGPGISDAIGLSPGETPAANGSVIFLPAVEVNRIHIRGGVFWWTVRDTEEPTAIGIIDAVPPLLRLRQTVDVQGTLYWVEGRPYLSNVRCWAYTDSAGNILYQKDFPYFRGLLTAPWPYTMELEVPHSLSAQSFGMVRAMDDDDPGAPGGADSAAGYTALYCNTISDAIACYDPNASEPIMVEIDAHPQTADPQWQGPGSAPDFILTEDTSSDQIPVVYANSGSISTGDRLNVTVGAIQCDSTGSNYSIAVDSLSQDQFPGYIQDIPQTVELPYARTCPLGTELTVQSLVVHADQTMFPNTLYCEASAGFCGCKIICDASDVAAYEGDTIDVTGQTGVDSDGEWYIDATQSTSSSGDITVDSSGPPAGIHGMTNAAIGGKYNGTAGQGVTNGVGLINSGWLVRTWGTVVYVDPGSTFFLMDDGSRVSNSANVTNGGGTVLGLRVDLTSPMIAPEAGWVLGVNGISSCDSAGGVVYRVLRPRTQADFAMYEPLDPSNPSVTLDAPPDSVLHKASSATSMWLEGTASANVPIVSIVVTIDTAASPQVTFNNSTSTSWSCHWTGMPTSGTSSHTISVTATDYAGRTATLTRSFTLYNISPIYVGTWSSGSQSGTSWLHAYHTIQQALSAATSGGEIWVASGTYEGDFSMSKANVGLYGGFDFGQGTPQTAREQRNWAVGTTILDANSTAGGTVVSITASGCVVDGFTIQNGGQSTDAGISCTGVTATIQDNVIKNNNAGGYCGGGLYAEDSTLTVANNVLMGNTAEQGGGIYYDSTGGVVADNTIIDDVAESGGGGIYLTDKSSPAMSNNIIAFNTGGGIYQQSGGTASFTKRRLWEHGLRLQRGDEPSHRHLG